MESSADDCAASKIILSKVNSIATSCLQQKLEEPVEEVQNWSNYVTDRSEISSKLKEILSLLQSLPPICLDQLQGKDILLAIPLVLLFGEHRTSRNSECQPWSNPELVTLADEDLQELCRILNASDLNDFFSKDVVSRGNQRNSFLMGCLKSLKAKVSKNEWKFHPAAVEALVWLIHSIRHPTISEFANEVLPPVLIFLDDYNDDYKLLGLDCLGHIIRETTKGDLLRENWASVLLNALQSLLYDRNAVVVRRIMDPILFLLRIVECDPDEFSHKFTQYDVLSKNLLTALECCIVPECKVVYVEHLTKLVKTMKLATLHWRKRIREALLHLTATTDANLMKAILECSSEVVKNTWIKPDSLNLSEVMLRILMNISALEILSIEDWKTQELIELCVQNFKLFQVLDDYPLLHKELLTMQNNKKLNSQFLSALNTILEKECQK